MSDEEFLDPTDSVVVPRKTAQRLESLDGKTITLLDRVEELLRERTQPRAVSTEFKRAARAQADALGARLPDRDGRASDPAAHPR